MSIASAIQSKQQQVAAAYTACNNKGATLPSTQNLNNLATCIGTITGGGSSGTPYTTIVALENTMRGTSEVASDEEAQACDDISLFLYGTTNS